MSSQELREDPQDHEKLVPRTRHQKAEILTVLELKSLKGSVVRERVDCGKRGCHKCQSGVLHGPYPYLHYYVAGKVKKRYLPKSVADLMAYSREELEAQLREADEALGQINNRGFSSHTCKKQAHGHDKNSSVPTCHKTLMTTHGKNEACIETGPKDPGLEALVIRNDISVQEESDLQRLAPLLKMSVKTLSVELFHGAVRRIRGK